MTLLQQLKDIGSTQVNPEWVKHTTPPRMCEMLCQMAFVGNWDRTGYSCRVLLRYEHVLRTTGAVSVDEPGVPLI